MSELLLARNLALSCLPGETTCRDMQLRVETPVELLGLGFTRFPGPLPESMYPDDDDPMKVLQAVKKYANEVRLWTSTLVLTATLELHDRAVDSGKMHFELSLDEDGAPHRIYGRARFANQGKAILFPGETYTLKSTRAAVNPDLDVGLSHSVDLWGLLDG